MNLADPTDVLARTLYGEARGEGHEGMCAVANVIKNRVAKPGKWGRDIIGVCLKPYQFSCWLQKDPNYTIITEIDSTDPIFQLATSIAEAAVLGTLVDNTDGATYYYAKYIDRPKWSKGMKICAMIGKHIFFKDA